MLVLFSLIWVNRYFENFCRDDLIYMVLMSNDLKFEKSGYQHFTYLTYHLEHLWQSFTTYFKQIIYAHASSNL